MALMMSQLVLYLVVGTVRIVLVKLPEIYLLQLYLYQQVMVGLLPMAVWVVLLLFLLWYLESTIRI
jgi:hypothetical protein